MRRSACSAAGSPLLGSVSEGLGWSAGPRCDLSVGPVACCVSACKRLNRPPPLGAALAQIWRRRSPAPACNSGVRGPCGVKAQPRCASARCLLVRGLRRRLAPLPPPTAIPAPLAAPAASRRPLRATRLCVTSKLVLNPSGSGKTDHIGEDVPATKAITLKEGLFEVGGAGVMGSRGVGAPLLLRADCGAACAAGRSRTHASPVVPPAASHRWPLCSHNPDRAHRPRRHRGAHPHRVHPPRRGAADARRQRAGVRGWGCSGDGSVPALGCKAMPAWAAGCLSTHMQHPALTHHRSLPSLTPPPPPQQITDLGSTNGTFVDGKELKAMEAVRLECALCCAAALWPPAAAAAAVESCAVPQSRFCCARSRCTPLTASPVHGAIAAAATAPSRVPSAPPPRTHDRCRWPWAAR